MATQFGLTLFFLIAIGLLLVINEMIYRRLGLKGEITRKFAHLTATLSTITFPYLFESHWYVLFLAIVFFALLFVSKNRTYLMSIHDIDRISSGSYLLPVAIYVTFLISHILQDPFLFILPILVLAISDPLAGLLGVNVTWHNHRIVLFGKRFQKTYVGSGAFFITCLLISILAFYFKKEGFDLQSLLISLMVAIAGTTAELISPKGSDNLIIPLSVLLVLLVFL
jgi:phytol kinase